MAKGGLFITPLIYYGTNLLNQKSYEKCNKYMKDNVVKTCVVCHTEKSIDNFYNKDRECKQCNIKGVLKRYYSNKDDMIQKRRQEYARFIGLDNRKSLGRKPKRKYYDNMKDSENNQSILSTNFIQNHLKRIAPQTRQMFIILMIYGLWIY